MTAGNKRPIRWVPTLYVAEGLPFVAVMTVSVLMYKSLGLSDTKIAAFTSAVAWPWSLKPLWSGLMETAATKRRFVVGTQILAAVAFSLVGLSLGGPSFTLVSLSLLGAAALGSATHDIAADGLYIEVLTKEEQSRYIGYAGGFWSVGRILAQGILVWVAGVLERPAGAIGAWRAAMIALGFMMLSLALYHQRTLPPSAPRVRPDGARGVFREAGSALRSFFAQQHVGWGLVFVILYRFGEGQAMKILPLFLRAERVRGGLGLGTDQVGLAYGTLGAIACVAGSIAGGHYAARRGLRSALPVLCGAFNLPYICYLALAWFQPVGLAPVVMAVVVEWFGYGFGFVAVTLFMMQQMSNGKYKMSHYAIATSAMNLGLILPGAWSGWLSDYLGYRNFFVWVVMSTVLSFLAAWRVPFSDETLGETSTEAA